MKRVRRLVIYGLLSIALIATLLTVVFEKTSDLDAYVPALNKKFSKVLGRKVALGHLSLGLSLHGLALNAGPCVITDDPSFTLQPFMTIARVSTSLSLMSFILRREIRIYDILLLAPQVHMIRSQDGTFNVQSLGFHGPAAVSSGAGPPAVPAAAVPPAALPHPARPPSPVVIDSIYIKVRDASVSWIDLAQNIPTDVWLSNINADLSGLSFAKNPDGSKAVQLREGRLVMTDNVIKNFNVIDVIMSRAFGVTGGLDSFIDKDSIHDTIIGRAQAQFAYHDQKLDISHALVKTNVFELSAQGSVDLKGMGVDLQTLLHVNPDISASLVNAFGALRILCDESGRITIDAGLKGNYPRIKYKPSKDFRKKSRNALFRQLFGA